jgi:hypothetical protein
MQPEGPDTPDGPDGPETPDAPDGPDTPDGPDGPDTPEGPDAPEGPKSPTAVIVHEEYVPEPTVRSTLTVIDVEPTAVMRPSI